MNYSIEAKVYLQENNDMFVANAQVNIFFGGAMVFVNQLSVVNGQNGLFISWPKQTYEQNGETKYKPIVGGNKQLYAAVENAIISEYNKQKGITTQPAQQVNQVQQQVVTQNPNQIAQTTTQMNQTQNQPVKNTVEDSVPWELDL